MNVEVLARSGDRVGESPVWDADAGRLWWIDILGHAVRRVGLDGERLESVALDAAPGALALAADGHPVVAAGTGWAILTARGPEWLAMAGRAGAGWRMNDGAVDTAGRLWTGSVAEPRDSGAGGNVFLLDANGPHRVVSGLETPNGLAVSPDGRTLYLADSHPRRCVIWAFDLEPETGAITCRRQFHRPRAGRPDGAAIDAEGCYWFAAIDAGLLVRLDPRGREIASIELPVRRPTNLAFAGPGLDVIVVTTMSEGLTHDQRAAEPLAGALLRIDAGCPGWPQPRMTVFPAVPPAAQDPRLAQQSTGGRP